MQLNTIFYILFLGACFSCYSQNHKRDDSENGFSICRKALGYGENNPYFDNPKANKLREYLKASLITYENAESYGTAGFSGGAQYVEKIAFCKNGLFVFQNTTNASIGGDGLGGIDSENMHFSGYWETFTQNSMTFIALYSKNPQMLAIHSKGFIPYLVKSYKNEMIRIAGETNDVIYRRAHYNCY